MNNLPVLRVAGIVFSVTLPVLADDEIRIENLSTPVADASYRSAAMQNGGTAYVGGSNGTLLKSSDGGQSWVQITSPDFADLDFRDVELIGDSTVVLMSAGPGGNSRLFRSDDGGTTWETSHTNPLADGFFNGMAFWPDGRGMVVGDPIDGRLLLLRTEDSGRTWKRTVGPIVIEGEYGFAASGTGVTTNGTDFVAVATGAAAARAMVSEDNGETWKIATLPMRHGRQSEGAFSVAFRNSQFGVAVGGDYLQPDEATRNCAISSDGGQSWQEVPVRMPHKACVRFLDDDTVLAVGRTGIMLSADRGATWKTVSDESFYTFDYNKESRTGILAGAAGRVASFAFTPSE